MGFKKYGMYKIWKDIAAEAMETDYKVPGGKGNRSIVCHVGSAESELLKIVCFHLKVQNQINLQIITQK